MSQILFSECRSSENGGAICCITDGADVWIKTCSFTRCYSDWYGGAVYFRGEFSATINNVYADTCDVRSSGKHPYGSFGYMECNSIVSNFAMTNSSSPGRGSIGIYPRLHDVTHHCCNFTGNNENVGYASLLYFYYPTSFDFSGSIYANNSCSYLLFEAYTTISYSMFIGNSGSLDKTGTFYKCCFYDNSLPISTDACITDHIEWMTNYENCRFVMSTTEFTGEKQPCAAFIMLLLAQLIL